MCSAEVKGQRYLESGLLPVVEEHQDGHLEGGHLQNVLPGVGARHLCPTHSCVRTVLLGREEIRSAEG